MEFVLDARWEGAHISGVNTGVVFCRTRFLDHSVPILFVSVLRRYCIR